MIHHYITKYWENGKFYAERWLQINAFGKCFCFSRRKIEIPKECMNCNLKSLALE